MNAGAHEDEKRMEEVVEKTSPCLIIQSILYPEVLIENISLLSEHEAVKTNEARFHGTSSHWKVDVNKYMSKL